MKKAKSCTCRSDGDGNCNGNSNGNDNGNCFGRGSDALDGSNRFGTRAPR